MVLWEEKEVTGISVRKEVKNMYRKFEAPEKNVIFYSKLGNKWGKVGFGDLLGYRRYEGPRTMISEPIIHWKVGHVPTGANGTIQMYKLLEIPALIKDWAIYNRRRLKYERSLRRRKRL